MAIDLPYAELFAELGSVLEEQPQQRLELWWSEAESFACSRCGMGCRRPWQVRVSRDYVVQWGRPLAQLTGLSLAELFVPLFDEGDKAWAHLGKMPGSDDCLLLDSDGLCRIHKHWGAHAKPEVCRNYPHAGIEDPHSDYNSPSLALSCTRAAQMLLEPQQLSWRFVSAPQALPRPPLALAPGRRIENRAWLIWTGHALDALEHSDFSQWLQALALGLEKLLALPFELIKPPDLEPLAPAPTEPPLSRNGRRELCDWLGRTTIGPLEHLHPILPWLDALAEKEMQMTPAEATLLELQTRAYWRRQLLLPALLLRGELDLAQYLLTLALQGSLIRLWALFLRQDGSLTAAHLNEASNTIFLYLVRDHLPETQRRWRQLAPSDCLARIRLLAGLT